MCNRAVSNGEERKGDWQRLIVGEQIWNVGIGSYSLYNNYSRYSISLIFRRSPSSLVFQNAMNTNETGNLISFPIRGGIRIRNDKLRQTSFHRD